MSGSAKVDCCCEPEFCAPDVDDCSQVFEAFLPEPIVFRLNKEETCEVVGPIVVHHPYDCTFKGIRFPFNAATAYCFEDTCVSFNNILLVTLDCISTGNIRAWRFIVRLVPRIGFERIAVLTYLSQILDDCPLQGEYGPAVTGEEPGSPYQIESFPQFIEIV
ncbi:MAG: hypothetical protein V3S55_09470 [Nitrospiraceae bacterium]